MDKVSRKAWMYLLPFILLWVPHAIYGQFSNRYPKVKTYRHHIYLEAFEFPFYANGPVSPVASPNGKKIAFSAMGWIWIMEKADGKATRITKGGENDFLPAWSVRGEYLAFVRDTGKETFIQVVSLDGKDFKKIDHINASELDPYFSPDGNFIYYTSSVDGTFDIWRFNLNTDQKEKITHAEDGLEMRPVPYGANGNFYFISKSQGVIDQIKHFDASSGNISVVDEGRILSQLWTDTNEPGDQLVLNWSNTLTWSLNVKKGALGAPKLELFSDENYVIYPSWDKANSSLLFSMAGKNMVFEMFEIPEKGGSPQKLEVKEWDYGSITKAIQIGVIMDSQPVNARLSVSTDNGHYLIPDGAVPRFDSQNGEVYFYTSGKFDLQVPSGKIRVKASHGLFAHSVSDWMNVNDEQQIKVEINKAWDKPGWYSGDHHFHMNYGGPFKMRPEDLVPILKAEDLDFATPMAANLHFQLKDQEYMNWEHTSFPKIRFGQEIRSHFHGHIGLFGNNQVYHPWFWGPILYETNTFDDRLNDEALIFGRKNNQIGVYVHPISEKDPLASEAKMSGVPVGLVADVVNGNLDAFEMACLWSDEIGSSVIYHQFLNLGIPLALSAGTDAFPAYARNMAVGATRIWVNTGANPDWNEYLDGIRKGKSLVSNGPIIELNVAGSKPGETIPMKGKRVIWEMEIYAQDKLDKVELIMNGKVVWSSKEVVPAGTKKFSDKLTLPSGGWIAARVSGSGHSWPLMDSYSFAHTSPIWIDRVGSFDTKARSESAELLLKVMDLSWKRIKDAYTDHPTSVQEKSFNQARQRLEEMKSN